MRIKVNMYVCSKPLQYFNIRNLPRSDTDKNILIIEDKFKDSWEFYEQIMKFDTSWYKVLYIKDRAKILYFGLLKYRITNIYYYMDFNSLAGLLLYTLPCKNILVYEEGISAYRTDIWDNTAQYKRKIKKLLRLPDYAGHHPRVKGFFVYDKDKYIKIFSHFTKSEKLKPLPFIVPFQKMIDNNVNIALNIFQFHTERTFLNIKNKKVLLYITSWPLQENVLKNICTTKYDYYIIKPHPQITDLALLGHFESNNVLVIRSVILAEFLIKILTGNNNQVDIFHHNSSAVMYLDEDPKIHTVVNLNQQQN